MYYIKEKYTERFNRLTTEGLITDSKGNPIISSTDYGNGYVYNIVLDVYIKTPDRQQRGILNLILKILEELEIDYSEVKIKYIDNQW